MRRTSCGGCGSARLDPILDLDKTPVANTLPASPDEPEDLYPLQLGVCRDCWLVQQLEVVPDAVLYGAGYAFYASASLPKVAYHRDLSRYLYTQHRDLARRFTVEVGCNDGDLLRHFHDVGCHVLGIDPSAPAAQAQQRGLPVLVEPFGAAAAERIAEEQGQAGLIIANHVAAHVADVQDLFAGFGRLLAPDGLLVVEVQSLSDLLIGNQLDHVYHEHRFHYSLTSLAAVAARHGLHPLDVRHTDAQSGSLSVTFGRDAQLQTPKVEARLWGESWLREPATYTALQGRAEYLRELLLDAVDAEVTAGRRIAGMAAPAKATTLLNWCGLSHSTIEYVVDTTPAKQGRYLPGTGIPIVGREWNGNAAALYHRTLPQGRDLPDTWLVLAWNYLSAILRREWEFTNDGGRWLVPIPTPVLL